MGDIKPVVVRFPEELLARIDVAAAEAGMKRSKWILGALEGSVGLEPALRTPPRETPRIDTPWGPPMKAATKKAAPPPRQHQVGCSCLMCKEGK